MPLVSADFIPLPRHVMPLSLVLVPAFDVALAGHVRLLSELRADALDGGRLVERGIFHCPCEIDVALTDLFERAGPSYAFDFFFEPQGEIETKLEVELHRSHDGRTWGVEKLLTDCRPGIARTAPVRNLKLAHKLRLRMRFVAKTPGAVRVWMREPIHGKALGAAQAEVQHA